MTKIALNSEVKNEFVVLKTCPWKNILRQKTSELRRKMENDLVAFQDLLVNRCLIEEARTFNRKRIIGTQWRGNFCQTSI